VGGREEGHHGQDGAAAERVVRQVDLFERRQSNAGIAQGGQGRRDLGDEAAGEDVGTIQTLRAFEQWVVGCNGLTRREWQVDRTAARAWAAPTPMVLPDRITSCTASACTRSATRCGSMSWAVFSLRDCPASDQLVAMAALFGGASECGCAFRILAALVLPASNMLCPLSVYARTCPCRHQDPGRRWRPYGLRLAKTLLLPSWRQTSGWRKQDLPV
jgi:hypothetical protein